MKKIKSILACFLVFSHFSAYASCDFSTDIKENANGTFTYSRECHIEVGKAFKTISILEQRLDNFEKKINLKDLVIKSYEERTQLWIDTSLKLNDKIQSYEKVNNVEKWSYFAFGAGLVIASVWAAGQALK